MACISIASSQKKCITLHFLSDNWISLTALFGLASRRIFTSKDASFTSQCRGVQPFFYNYGDVWAIWKLRANSELPSVQIIQALVASELTCDCWAVWNTSNFENSNTCSSPKTKKTIKKDAAGNAGLDRIILVLLAWNAAVSGARWPVPRRCNRHDHTYFHPCPCGHWRCKESSLKGDPAMSLQLRKHIFLWKVGGRTLFVDVFRFLNVILLKWFCGMFMLLNVIEA